MTNFFPSLFRFTCLFTKPNLYRIDFELENRVNDYLSRTMHILVSILSLSIILLFAISIYVFGIVVAWNTTENYCSVIDNIQTLIWLHGKAWCTPLFAVCLAGKYAQCRVRVVWLVVIYFASATTQSIFISFSLAPILLYSYTFSCCDL